MDHANLTKYREPQKLTGRIARYMTFLTRFNYQFVHLPGKQNRADALSRRSDHQPTEGEDEKVIALPDHLFARVIQPALLDEMIRRQQKQKEHQKMMEEWKIKYGLQQKANHWRKDRALVVVAPETVQRALMEIYHDKKTAGHPGQAKTYQGLARDYWWPSMRHFVSEYVKGCAVCQANKIVTHRNNPPLQPIKLEEGVAPFQTIAMDFIVKLPPSQGYNALWTITDHDCTKAVILIPCKEEISAEELAILYKDRVFPWIGLPNKVISDRDPRFTSNLM